MEDDGFETVWPELPALDPDATLDENPDQVRAWLQEELLDAVKDMWEARCSRKNYPDRYVAPFVSFGVSAAKQRVYDICEELWGDDFAHGPIEETRVGALHTGEAVR